MTKSSLGDFFERNSRLFTALGVFGAISVYFTQLELETRWRRLGIVSSLTIFILIAIAIQRNIPPESSERQTFDFVIDREERGFGLVVFYISLYAVVFSVIGVIIQFSDTLTFLFQFLCAVGGFSVVQWFVNIADEYEDSGWTIGEDYQVVIESAMIMKGALYGLILGSGGLVLLWLQGAIPVQQLIDFRITSIPLAILIGFFSGLVGGGVLYALFSILVATSHYLLYKLREISAIDEEGNVNIDQLLWDEDDVE